MHGPYSLPPHTDVSRKVITGLLHLPYPKQKTHLYLAQLFYSRRGSKSLHQHESSQIDDKSQRSLFSSCYTPVYLPYCHNRAVFFSRSNESWHSYDSGTEKCNIFPRRSLMLNYYFVN